MVIKCYHKRMKWMVSSSLWFVKPSSLHISFFCFQMRESECSDILGSLERTPNEGNLLELLCLLALVYFDSMPLRNWSIFCHLWRSDVPPNKTRKFDKVIINCLLLVATFMLICSEPRVMVTFANRKLLKNLTSQTRKPSRNLTDNQRQRSKFEVQLDVYAVPWRKDWGRRIPYRTFLTNILNKYFTLRGVGCQGFYRDFAGMPSCFVFI